MIMSLSSHYLFIFFQLKWTVDINKVNFCFISWSETQQVNFCMLKKQKTEKLASLPLFCWPSTSPNLLLQRVINIPPSHFLFHFEHIFSHFLSKINRRPIIIIIIIVLLLAYHDSGFVSIWLKPCAPDKNVC